MVFFDFFRTNIGANSVQCPQRCVSDYPVSLPGKNPPTHWPYLLYPLSTVTDVGTRGQTQQAGHTTATMLSTRRVAVQLAQQGRRSFAASTQLPRIPDRRPNEAGAGGRASDAALKVAVFGASGFLGRYVCSELGTYVGNILRTVCVHKVQPN
jgi:hypothetical protein